jgi:hypothetical protein
VLHLFRLCQPPEGVYEIGHHRRVEVGVRRVVDGHLAHVPLELGIVDARVVVADRVGGEVAEEVEVLVPGGGIHQVRGVRFLEIDDQRVAVDQHRFLQGLVDLGHANGHGGSFRSGRCGRMAPVTDSIASGDVGGRCGSSPVSTGPKNRLAPTAERAESERQVGAQEMEGIHLAGHGGPRMVDHIKAGRRQGPRAPAVCGRYGSIPPPVRSKRSGALSH